VEEEAAQHEEWLVDHGDAIAYLEENPEEAVIVNIAGTANLIAFARRVAAERFVLISTDKAVAPRSVMGATKKVAELLVLAASRDGDQTSFMTVRFGNVLGSRGSVVPLFKQRIRQGRPLPITDERMTRYFMTIKEAVLLVIEAMVLGENGATYILEMGEPVSILELAKNLLVLSGYDPENGDSGPGIEVMGLRPGEKLHESLIEDDEVVEPSPNPLIHKACPRREVVVDPSAVLAVLVPPAAAGDREGVRTALERLLGDLKLTSDQGGGIT